LVGTPVVNAVAPLPLTAKLQDKVINLGIRELIPFGGRLGVTGKIVGLVGK
jgi:hypothetical protein